MPKTGFHYFLIGLLVVSLLAAGIRVIVCSIAQEHEGYPAG